MPPTLTVDPRFALAPWLAVRDHASGPDALRTLLRERLAGLALRAYDAAAGGGGNLVGRLPGRSPSLRPVVLLARTDLLDPSALAALAAAVAVPSLLAGALLDRDVLVVLADDAPGPEDPGSHRDGRARAAPAPPRRPGARAWFEHQRQHDVKAAVVVDPLHPARWTPPGGDLLRVHGIETDARMPGVVDGAAPQGCHLVLARHGDDALPFAAHALPYLAVGGAIRPAGTGDAAAPPPARGAAAPTDAAAPTRADLERLTAHAARLAATLLARLDGARLPGPFHGYDSTPHELAAYGAALGEALGDPPRTREDLERRILQIWG
jgi:hypothetical protein